MKKLIWENRAKNVNQKGTFYLLPKRNIRQYLVFFNTFYHYFNQKIKIWRKLPIWRNTVTLILSLTVWIFSYVGAGQAGCESVDVMLLWPFLPMSPYICIDRNINKGMRAVVDSTSYV